MTFTRDGRTDRLRQHTAANEKLDIITSKLSKLDSIETKLSRLESSVYELRKRVENVEEKNQGIEQSVDFLSSKYDTEAKKLSELAESVQKKMREQENSIKDLQIQLDTMKDSSTENVQKTQTDIIKVNTEIKRHSTMIEGISKSMSHIRRERADIDEKITDLQFRSMKMNLVFTGLGGETREEDTLQKLRCFLENELQISKHIEFGNVHRFGRFQWRKDRPIVARFLYQADLDVIIARASWLRGTRFGVHRQYPAAMEERRRILIPIMRQYRDEGAHVKLVRDRLYVNGERFDPADYLGDNDCDARGGAEESMDFARVVHGGSETQGGAHSG